MPLSRAQQIEVEERLNRFADLLSLDVDMSAICERMNITSKRAGKYLQRIRRRLGPQAV